LPFSGALTSISTFGGLSNGKGERGQGKEQFHWLYAAKKKGPLLTRASKHIETGFDKKKKKEEKKITHLKEHYQQRESKVQRKRAATNSKDFFSPKVQLILGTNESADGLH